MPGIAAADSHVTVVAGGLNNPRGVAIAPNGQVYVAEAGTGGAGPCVQGPEGDEVCLGATGSIARVSPGTVRRIVTGLPSLAGADGSAANGPAKLSFRGQGNLYATIGLGADPAARAAFGAAGARLGTLVRVSVANGKLWRAADLAAYEAAKNPDGGYPDSNPYGVLATPAGIYTTDAGGNDLGTCSSSRSPRTASCRSSREVSRPSGAS